MCAIGGMRAHPSQIEKKRKIARSWIGSCDKGKLPEAELRRELDESCELSRLCTRPLLRRGLGQCGHVAESDRPPRNPPVGCDTSRATVRRISRSASRFEALIVRIEGRVRDDNGSMPLA